MPQGSRTQHYGKACTPCAQRKVRCNGIYPCENCIKRDQQGSCTPKIRKARTSKPLPEDRPATGIESDQIRGTGAHHVQRGGPSSNNGDVEIIRPSHPSRNSTPSFGDIEGQSRDGDIAQTIRPALGLENTSRIYPFMISDLAGGEVRWQNVLLPSHEDILKYSQVYQNMIAPFYPFIPDEDDLESLVCNFLEESAEYERPMSRLPRTNPVNRDIRATGLMNAILACGAQMSDLPPDSRAAKSRHFAQAAFQCARMANFLLQPHLETLQALLILSFFLQNDGQADASWALLGSVSRLAMSLRLDQQSGIGYSEGEQHKRYGVWFMVIWQDCVLSFCFDRAPLAWTHTDLKLQVISTAPHTPFAKHIGSLVNICRSWLLERSEFRGSIDLILKYLKELDSLEADIELDPRVETGSKRRGRIAKLAFQLQISHITTMICRPALKISPSVERENDLATTRNRIQSSIQGTMQAFLDLRSLTILPFRSWSMIHAGIRSAIMVELVELDESLSTLREVQTNFIDILSREMQKESETAPGCQPWLLSVHLNHLKALQKLTARRKASQNRSQATMAGPVSPLFDLDRNQPNVGGNVDGSAATSSLSGDQGQEQHTHMPYNPDLISMDIGDINFDDWSLGPIDNYVSDDMFSMYPYAL